MYCKKPFLFVNKVLKKQQQKTIKINKWKLFTDVYGHRWPRWKWIQTNAC